MRILVLHALLGVLRGGGENFTRRLFEAFSERGHRITTAFIADRRGEYEIALPASMEPAPLPGWWSSNPGQGLLSTIGSYVPAQSDLRRKWDRIQEAVSWRMFRWHNQRFQRRVERDFQARWNHFDAAYVHGDALLASSVAQHRPTILRLPGPVGPDLCPALRRVHAVVANGDALVRVRQFLGDHVTELPVGLDTHRFTPGSTCVRQKLGWADVDFVLGYVGRLSHLKGVDLLAAAFHQISGHDNRVRLLIVGSGEEERHLRTVLAKEIQQGSVHMEAGLDQEDLPQWYRAMDVLVMPSRYENHSNAMLEAMACGVPFLASSVGGNIKLSETGAGWLFEAGSVSALSESIHSLVLNPSECKHRGLRTTSAIGNHYSWNASAERLEAIIFSRLGIQP